MPVSDEKISLEYKLKRWIDGSWLHPDEAHFFWNGTFSTEQREADPCAAPTATACGSWWTGSGLEDGSVVDRYLQVDQNYYLPDDILYKTRPHEHGAFARGAAAVPGPPHRGVRRLAARRI